MTPQSSPRPVLAAGITALALLAAIAPPVRAQSGGHGFLFEEPIGTFSLRAGYNRASTGSDLLSFVKNELTLGRQDFDAITGAADLAFRITPRVDVAFGVGYTSTRAGSEFRDWVDQNNQPIEQVTELRRVPITATLRYYLVPRGHRIGQLAWVPNRIATYVGGGGGLMRYDFHQVGDFVDYQTLNVFHDEFRTSGWTRAAHALAGIELALGTRVAVTTEVRYTYAKGRVSGSFEGFDRIDLSGLSVTAGFAVRFSNGRAR